MSITFTGRVGSVCAWICAFVILTPLGAQTTASIFGTVTDESGAVVVGAKVMAVNTLTNDVRTTESNAVGAFAFPQLAVGLYRVQCELQGFKTWIQQGIELTLNRNARVDIELKTGSLSENITVVADAPLVETATNEMGSLVDRRRVVELPLNGRNTLSLVSLVPGTQQLDSSNEQGFRENRVNVNGARQNDSNWVLDGGDNTSPLRNSGNDVPNPDAIQETRVITNNYGAEYGRTIGAVVNVITRSGTNQFHGSAFEFLRNRRLNARNFFEAATTPLVQNQFGGTLGGPVRRDKTFFFGSYQKFPIRSELFLSTAQVPTAAERRGDFSASVDRAGGPIVVRDPATGRPFPANVIPQARVSPIAVRYLELAIPLPNYPANGPNGLRQTAGRPLGNQQFMAKLDHLLSSSHRFSGAYFWSDTVDGQRFISEIDFARRDVLSRQHNLNLHEYWTIGPNRLNHLRATYTRSAGNRKVTPDNVTWNDLGARFAPLAEGPVMPPATVVRGYFTAGSGYGGPKVGNHYVVSEEFSWLQGRHEWRFGAEGWLRRLFDVSTNPNMGGNFTFDGTSTGNGMGDLMLGLAQQMAYANQTYKSNNSWAFYWFAQDRVRVARKLVLNLGVRYELDTWPVHPCNELLAYVPGRQSTCVPQAPAGLVFPCDSGIPRAGAQNDYNNFAPRFGLAYDVFGDGRTVVRTGYGISYAFALFNTLQEGQVSVPFRAAGTVRNTTLADPYGPIGGSPFPFSKDPANLKFPPQQNYQFQDFHQRNGYVQQYNFSLQRQFGRDWSAELAYVGNISRKLSSSYDLNPPERTPTATNRDIDPRRPLYPTFLIMKQIGGFENASYNALQARLEKRFSQGFTLLGAYTWGKGIDQSSSFDPSTQWVDQKNRWLDRARSSFDRLQTLVLSWVWEAPFLSRSQGPAAWLLGGWSLNGIATFYAGQPVLIFSGRDNDYDGLPTDRPNVIGDWRLSPNRSRQEVVRAWFSQRAFAENAPRQLGNLGRNVVTAPGFKQLTLGIVKEFRIREGHRVQFRTELFNAFNWVNLLPPFPDFSRATFGQILTAGAPRVIQLGLRYSF